MTSGFKPFTFSCDVYVTSLGAWCDKTSSRQTDDVCFCLIMVAFVLLLQELGVTKDRHVKRMMYDSVNGRICVTSLGAWLDKSLSLQTDDA